MLLYHVVVLQLLNAMVAKLGNREDPLPQELFEGVDEDEWVKKITDIQNKLGLF